MKDGTVAGVVVTLVLVLSDGAGPDLEYDMHTRTSVNGRMLRNRSPMKICLFNVQILAKLINSSS